jgi:hypothetical protein
MVALPEGSERLQKEAPIFDESLALEDAEEPYDTISRLHGALH